MVKRVFAIMAALAAVMIMPIRAQDETPRNWIPADFAGFISLQTNQSDTTLTGLSMASLVQLLVQPTRQDIVQVQSLDDLFPLTHLDVEGVTFANSILPWLGNEMVVGYRQFENGLAASLDDQLLILPTRDALLAASSLSSVINGQDLLERESYRDAVLYNGDKTAIAIAPQAVLIGPKAAVEAALDVMAGEGERLVDLPAYTQVMGGNVSGALATAYFDGALALETLSYILDGDDSAVPLLGALGEALSTARGEASFEQVVLGDSLDGIGISVTPDTLRFGTVRATLTLYDRDQPELETTATFNTGVLDFIPQNAIIAQSGADAAGAVYDVLYALPLTNFAGQILGAFAVSESAGAASGMIAQPQADDLRVAVEGLVNVLRQVADFDLEADLLDYLEGSYTLAVLPRPNDPTIYFNTPFDVLLVAEVNSGASMLEAATFLTRIILGIGEPESVVIGGSRFYIFRFTDGQPLISLGVVDNFLVIASGDALQLALDARRGDNQFISRDRWASVSRDAIPQFYVSIPGFYSTFLPQAGGTNLRVVDQLGAWTEYAGQGVYQVHFLVTLPGEIG